MLDTIIGVHSSTFILSRPKMDIRISQKLTTTVRNLVNIMIVPLSLIKKPKAHCAVVLNSCSCASLEIVVIVIVLHVDQCEDIKREEFSHAIEVHKSGIVSCKILYMKLPSGSDGGIPHSVACG